MTARERARKKVGAIVKRYGVHLELAATEDILAIPELEVKSDDQTTPANPYAPEDRWIRKAYSRAQQDMLNDNWKRME